jgi:peptidoglycan/LPS O-acetylase OafA/YrhL
MEIQNPLAYFILLPLLCLLSSQIGKTIKWSRTAHEKGAPNRYYSSIDGLRGVLAMSVFFYHAISTYFYFRTGDWDSPPSHFYAQMGPFAVTMFFFITGFLFWSKQLESEQGLKFIPFLIKRAKRLLPAYYFSAFVAVILLWMHFGAHLNVSLPKLIAQVGTWVACGVPFDFARLNDWPDAFRVNAGVFWTLRIEWGFYILLPFLGWFAKKWRVLILFGICAVLGLAIPHIGAGSMIVTKMLDLPERLATSMLTCFSVGILAAHAKKHWNWGAVLGHWLCTPIAVALWLTVMFLASPAYPYLLSALLAPIFFMIVFGNDFHGILSSNTLAYLGTISYSIYLMHGIVLYAFMETASRFVSIGNSSAIEYWALMAIVGALVIVVSSLTYRLIEYPWMGVNA